MKLIRYFLLFTLPLMLAANLQAHGQDAEGCKDSPIITRMPGSVIDSCDNKEFDQAKMPLEGGKERSVEGEFHSWTYRTRVGLTEVQLFRNIQSALKKAGFTLDYSDEDSYGTVTAHKGGTWYTFDNHAGSSWYAQTIVIEKQMEQEVTADAASLSNDLYNRGHASVYGIHFDTGKADMKPESEAELKEIAKLLQQDPALKIYVVGHTDNVGTLASNMDLSRRRAEAVLKALTAQYSVAPTRLQAFGSGPYAPVASNDTDQGRALNRRVELVKQ